MTLDEVVAHIPYFTLGVLVGGLLVYAAFIVYEEDP